MEGNTKMKCHLCNQEMRVIARSVTVEARGAIKTIDETWFCDRCDTFKGRAKRASVNIVGGIVGAVRKARKKHT